MSLFHLIIRDFLVIFFDHCIKSIQKWFLSQEEKLKGTVVHVAPSASKVSPDEERLDSQSVAEWCIIGIIKSGLLTSWA